MRAGLWCHSQDQIFKALIKRFKNAKKLKIRHFRSGKSVVFRRLSSCLGFPVQHTFLFLCCRSASSPLLQCPHYLHTLKDVSIKLDALYGVLTPSCVLSFCTMIRCDSDPHPSPHKHTQKNGHDSFIQHK